MSIEATFDPSSHLADVESASFKQLGPDLAIFKVFNDDSLGPIVSPDLLPAGWVASPDREDAPNPFPIFCENGDFIELYILEREQ